jgi:hypothetical protein
MASPRPTARLETATAVFELSLEPGEEVRSVLRIASGEGDQKVSVGRAG